MPIQSPKNNSYHVSSHGKTIAVIGLGYVGLPLAVEFGRYRPVIGFDIKSERIKELLHGVDQTRELSKEELQSAPFLRFTDDENELSEAQIYIVTVPTPVDTANRPDLGPLVNASRLVGRILKDRDIVVFESTVYPGATEEVCVPVLKEESGLDYLCADSAQGPGFYCGYSPERINPGDKTHRISQIKKVVSGSTPVVAEEINALYSEIIGAGTHLASSIRVAEAAKVIENAQRDLNIAFVNELSVIFNRMGVDTAEVLAAASTKWNFLPFTPGLVGGHCIGVDPYYLTHKAQELGYQPQVILAGRRINDNMGRYAARNLIRLMIRNKIDVASSVVGVLGLTFKEGCPDTRNSRSFDIVHELESWGVQVKVYDPLADSDEISERYGLVLSDLNGELGLDSLVLAVAHDEYRQLGAENLRLLCKSQSNPVIADLKSIYARQSLETLGFTVFRF